ncbi:MAG: hypothetical protein CFE43_10140 [Burkholderiales bacterium PBB3]|nr:MAG: hypothetical protein CFE43_10140 [Burkholderiales bacterium PBB3]
MLRHQFKALAGALLSGLCSLTAHAQVAQSPLLAKTQGQVPNIVFIFDDSGSMPATAIYQYGGVAGGLGWSGPGDDAGNSAPTTFHGRSPNVNLIYYDPRETFSRRINADGTYQAAGDTSAISSFDVYFYKPPSTTVYSVSGVSVVNKGSLYPASGVTGTFTAAPGGGTTATATVTTASSTTANSVTINSKGTGYPATGVTASFSAPSAGGVRATGTVTVATSNKVNSVTVNKGGRYSVTPTAATFSAPGAGGVTAIAGAPTFITTKVVTSVPVTNGGTGYTNGANVTFTAAPSTGVTTTGTINTTSYNVASGSRLLLGGSGYTAATATVVGTLAAWGTASTCTITRGGAPLRTITAFSCTAGTGYLSPPTLNVSTTGGVGFTYTPLPITTTTGKIASINITNSGDGYLAAPTATCPGCGGSGAAFGTVVTANTQSIATIPVSNGGSEYAAAPTVTLVGATGSGAAFTTNLNSTYVISAINITNPGSGYTSTPTITLAGTSPGAGASWTVNTGTTNVIQSINVTNAGSGYLVAPTFTISSPTGSGATNTVTTTSSVVAGSNREWDGVGTPTTAASYFTPSYTPDANSPLAPTATALNYPNTASSATANYPKFKARTDCTSVANVCTWAEERQNYANWLTYHSTRLELAKTGIGLAFQPLTATFRLGWGTIGNDLDDNSRLASGVRLYDTAGRTAFFTWLYGRTGTQDTPNRIAVNKVGSYYMRKDDDGPWGASPAFGRTSTDANTGTANASHASCRRNYALLMTDGYYNETFTIADSDSTLQTNAAGVTYTPIGPYSDTASGTVFTNSFADVTHKYWFQSLRPDLNQTGLQSKPNDTATWPHMNFYAIGLGVTGNLNANDPAVLTALTGASPSRTLDWSAPTNLKPAAIDDMWHATINGRGLLLNAATASKLQKSILQIISDVGGLQDSQAGVAASSTSLTSSTRKFTPLFTSQYWTGNVKTFQLDSITANEVGLAWEVESVASTDPITGVSTYTSKIPLHGLRNIAVGNGATSGTRAVAFTKTAMDGAGITSLMTGTVTTDLINYLRGDASVEATDANSANPSAIYRPRQTRLGDIINSTPVFVKGDLNQKYDAVPGAPGYPAFLSIKKTQRSEGVLFVGANDGMLHGFRDGATAASGNSPNASAGGVEVFAYVPRAILPTLHLLADPFYGADASHPHRYYVDGPSVEADVYLPTANRWANVVLGSTGAGTGALTSTSAPKTGIFAIDTTSLSTSVTSLGANNVLWEVGSHLAAFAEVGFVTSKIESGPMLDGSWVAIFGNGFESASCKAQLFIVNMETGALLKKIDTNKGTCGAGTKNGLGGVELVRNTEQQIIGAYAGDLLGNVWKFDLNSASSANWKVDFGGDPLYKTRTGQPITASPTVIDLATTPANTTPKPGYMVVFETGKFVDTPDLNTTTTQTIYGVWDDKLFGASPTATSAARFNETQLQVRTNADLADGGNSIDFSVKKGWYYDLTNSGERMVFPMNPVLNRFVLGTSIAPSSSTGTDPCVTGTGGEGRRYFIDALSGASVSSSVMIIPPEPPPPPFVECPDPAVCQVISITSKPLGILQQVTCQLTNTCVIPGTPPGSLGSLKRRQWRQLFPR